MLVVRVLDSVLIHESMPRRTGAWSGPKTFSSINPYGKMVINNVDGLIWFEFKLFDIRVYRVTRDRNVDEGSFSPLISPLGFCCHTCMRP